MFVLLSAMFDMAHGWGRGTSHVAVRPTRSALVGLEPLQLSMDVEPLHVGHIPMVGNPRGDGGFFELNQVSKGGPMMAQSFAEKSWLLKARDAN